MDDKIRFALSVSRISIHSLLGQGKCTMQKENCKLKMALVGLTEPALGYANSAIGVQEHYVEPRVIRMMSPQRFDQLQAATRMNQCVGITSEVNEKVTKNDIS